LRNRNGILRTPSNPQKGDATAVYFEKIVRNFSRYNKYNLGAEMRTKCMDILKLIIKANSSSLELADELTLNVWVKDFNPNPDKPKRIATKAPRHKQ
jgi:hypothetical protein